MPPPTDPVPPEPKKETPPAGGAVPSTPAPLDPKSLLLPKKEAGPTPESAQRINAGALLAQEQAATLPPPPPTPAVTPPPPAKPAEEVQPLQTYGSDIQKVVHDGSVSTVSIAAAEADRRSKEPLNPAPAASGDMLLYLRSWGMIAGGIVLVLIAAAVLAFVFLRPTSVPIPADPIAPFIFVDESQIIPVEPAARARPVLMQRLQAAREAVKLPVGLIEWLYVAEPNSEEGANPRIFSIAELLDILASQIPPEMLRVLEGPYLLGVHSFDENQPFLLLQVESYETAYAGMLKWERTLKDDLAPLFTRNPSPHSVSDTPATTTASTTPQVLPTNFIDKVVENRDTRVIQNETGDIVLLWTFLGRNTILITTNEYTLREVLSRLKAAPVVPNLEQ